MIAELLREFGFRARIIRSYGEFRLPKAMVSASDGVTVVGWKNDTMLEWQLFGVKDEPYGMRGSAVAATGDRPAGVVAKDGTFLLFP